MSSAIFLILLSLFLETIRGEWRPLEGSSIPAPITTRHHASPRILDAEHCNLYKVVMHQDNYFQYIQYKAHIPDMKEFTLCTWHKFYNHSMDHPLFSYAIRDQPREIVSWVSNTERSSFYQLTVGGHTIYRLNYPIRLFKWYHACQSWNGRTGEWQLWINSERAGRGFYNLLVGKKIKGGGLAMTGQIQRQYGGGFSDSPKEGGLYGEITLVHLYKAALTAGKAYNNHKHHHAHKFHHEGTDEDLQPQIPQMTPLPEGVTEYPFLRGMQLVPRLPVQELNVIRQQQQLQQMQQMQQLQQMIQQQQQGAQLQVLDPALLTSPFAPQSVRLFKRDHSNSTSGSIAKTNLQTMPAEDTASHTDGTKKKRTVDFGVFPGVDLSSLYTGDTGFILGGGSIQDLAFNGQNDDISEEGPTRKWDEPAEWEVRSIMSLCSGCGEDPFRKANVLSWRETSKKLFAGALYVPATQQCHHF